MSKAQPVSGDEGVGAHRPSSVEPANFRRFPDPLLQELRRLPGAASTASDVLDDLGFKLAVPSSELLPRYAEGVVAGQVLTIRYLPERRSFANPELRQAPSRLAHHSVFALGRPGDCVVIDANGIAGCSVFGGIAARAARRAGVAGCVVDGAVRDLAEIREMRLPVWSRTLTPQTGKWRLEAVAINEPVLCGGVQVWPGDLMIADETGICFVPVDVAEAAVARILEVAAEERNQLQTP